MKLRMAYVELTETEDKNSSCGSYCFDDDLSDEDDDDQNSSRKTLAGMLSRYRIITRLPNNQWHDLGEYGDPPGTVRLHITVVKREDGKKEASGDGQCVNFQFKSTQDGAIDAFIDGAYKWYMNELRRLEDHSRYYYEMKVAEFKIGGESKDVTSSGTIAYKRYKLSNQRLSTVSSSRRRNACLHSLTTSSPRLGSTQFLDTLINLVFFSMDLQERERLP
jgi:hypothetical protein